MMGTDAKTVWYYGYDINMKDFFTSVEAVNSFNSGDPTSRKVASSSKFL